MTWLGKIGGKDIADPGMSKGGHHSRLAAWTFLVLLMLLANRILFEGGFLLPAPVGDSILFLDPAHNYCRTGFLGTDLIAVDPLNQHRFVWHGFVTPWLLARFNPWCSIAGFYWVMLVAKVATVVLTYFLARRYGIASWQAWSAAILVFAIQSKLGFRPDVLAISWVLVTESNFAAKRASLATVSLALLLWTQPTIFGIYALFLLLYRPLWLPPLLRPQPIIGFLMTFILLAQLYPFPLFDLLRGLARHALLIAGRQDEGLRQYYLFTHFLPLWSLLFIAVLAALVRRQPLLALLLPALWWFGPRVPPTLYNMLALLPLFTILAVAESPRRVGQAIALGALLVGTVGLAQLSLRDLLTLYSKSRTYAEARADFLSDVGNPKLSMEKIPDYARLWLREPAPLPTPNAVRYFKRQTSRTRVDYVGMSGRPSSPCPEQNQTAPPLRLWGLTIFNSPSGWDFYRCAEPRSADGEKGASMESRLAGANI